MQEFPEYFKAQLGSNSRKLAKRLEALVNYVHMCSYEQSL